MTHEAHAPHAPDAQLAAMTEFAAGLRYEELPGHVVQEAKRRLVDSIACALGALAHGCGTARIGERVAPPPAVPGHGARLLFSDRVVAAPHAAFVNNCLVRDLDYNDTSRGGHPSDMVGGLVGLAAAQGCSGRDLVTAIVKGYEVMIRLHASKIMTNKGWDQGYGVGMGTAAAAAGLLGLSAEQTRHALALTGVANVPMRASRSGQLSMWKGAATAFSSQIAMQCVLLAAEGMPGPEAPFTGRHGLADQIVGPMPDHPYPRGEGGDYAIMGVRTKYWPVAYQLQAVIWAGISLRERLGGVEPADIEVATCEFSRMESGSEPAKWDPRSRETADHSLPYVLAWTLRHGELGMQAYEEASYLDPTLRPVMARTRVTVDPAIDAKYPDVFHVRITATDVEGNRHEVECIDPFGHENNPMTEADLERKLTMLGTPVLGDRVEQALQALWSVDQRDVAATMDLMEVTAGDLA